LAVPSFTVNRFENGEWTDPDEVWQFGEEVILFNPIDRSVEPFFATFLGPMVEGTFETTIPQGLSMQTSRIPEKGRLTSDFGLEAGPGDRVWLSHYRDGLQEYEFLPDGEWSPEEPVLNLGQSFFILTGEPVHWIRSYFVNAAR